ncbi:hypothetical protein BXZ70DRAFT_1006637 [Cristinia sonorae]|uniref:Transmembrane protein n=1 Tax=Cristinia sonorae TaxID=1940300 RepID=A0A8K0XRP4_9AGAR|nr:hypothetical protein BXZ70DRAFT_1006637 [Cristinia sonorae]
MQVVVSDAKMEVAVKGNPHQLSIPVINMFFSKFLVPTFALLSAAVVVFASPVAQPVAELAKRGGGQDVYDTCKNLHDSCLPVIAGLTPLAAAADIVAKVDVLANLFADAKVNLLGLVGVDVKAQIDAIVALNVDLIVKLIVALSTCNILDLTIFAKIDAFVSAYLAALAKIDASVVIKIGKGIPLLNLHLFVTLKLILTATILGLVSILGL